MFDIPGLLVIGRLTVRSSYARNIEQPAAEGFDTVQFYLPPADEAIYRIRTFAVDHDIHVHRTGQLPDHAEFVRGHLDRVYGEVLASVDTVALRHLSTEDLIEAGITSGVLEAADGYAFWNPDGGHYRTQSEPAGPGEREGMAQVVYLGGIARFWLPDTWHIEMNPGDGGLFYDPHADSALRLSVLTFDTTAAAGPPRVRHVLKPGERAIDGGRLTTGHEFDVYEADDLQDGTRLRCWQIAQVLPGQCRIYLFSYAYPIEHAHALASELAMVDREVRRMVPHPDPV